MDVSDMEELLLTTTAQAPAGAGSEPGAPCRTLRWRPRSPNEMPDVAGFLGRWNRPGSARPQARLHTSADGNINTVGLPGIHEADDLDPGHPRWREAIEEGVWPLVRTLTTGDWMLVTYDSCQGHAYPDSVLDPAERRVGVLPRDAAEQAAVAAALCRAVGAAGPRMPAAVQLRLGRAELTCGRTGNVHSVLDLGVDRAAGADWSAYFAALAPATRELDACLRAERPAPGAGCGCGTPDRAGLRA
jgi:uncharacterized protein